MAIDWWVRASARRADTFSISLSQHTYQKALSSKKESVISLPTTLQCSSNYRSREMKSSERSSPISSSVNRTRLSQSLPLQSASQEQRLSPDTPPKLRQPQQHLCPPSPPRAVVNILGHTLIAPNTSLARAIVMGNDTSHTNKEESNIGAARREPRNSSAASPAQRQAASNLTVLLEQQQMPVQQPPLERSERTTAVGGGSPSNRSSGVRQREQEQQQRGLSTSSSTASSHHTADEADSASGPPPDTARLGRSAPVLLDRNATIQPLVRHHSTGRPLVMAASSFSRRKSAGHTVGDDKGGKVRR